MTENIFFKMYYMSSDEQIAAESHQRVTAMQPPRYWASIHSQRLGKLNENMPLCSWITSIYLRFIDFLVRSVFLHISNSILFNSKKIQNKIKNLTNSGELMF